MENNPDKKQTAYINTSPSPRRPYPACFWESHYCKRKGSASRAARNGLVKATFRKGRGGIQVWIFEDDALAWYQAGMPTEPEVKS